MRAIKKSIKLLPTNLGQKVLNKIRICSLENGVLNASLTVGESEADEHGLMQRGFSATAIDILTCISIEDLLVKRMVSVEMNFSFIESAKIGDDVLIEAKSLKTGKNLAYVEAEIRNKKTNSLLVKGSQILYILNK